MANANAQRCVAQTDRVRVAAIPFQDVPFDGDVAIRVHWIIPICKYEI